MFLNKERIEEGYIIRITGAFSEYSVFILERSTNKCVKEYEFTSQKEALNCFYSLTV